MYALAEANNFSNIKNIVGICTLLIFQQFSSRYEALKFIGPLYKVGIYLVLLSCLYNCSCFHFHSCKITIATQMPELICVVITFQIFAWEVLSFNICQNTIYPDS
jgi:hypothetical protein